MPCMPTEADLHPRTRERLADWRADPEVRGVLWATVLALPLALLLIGGLVIRRRRA